MVCNVPVEHCSRSLHVKCCSVFLTDLHCTVLHSRHVSIVGEGELHRLSAYIQLCRNLSVSQTNIIKAVGPRSLLFISTGLKRPGHETNHSPASPPSLRIPEIGRAIVHFPTGLIMCTDTTAVRLTSATAGCVRRVIAYCIVRRSKR